ncbi:MAG: class I SAM-dependent methyltransferase [Parasporobacterium sp.]|nr:class I SAM-dependent methyltransferase [Parasporobacterium sp.]
MNDSNRNNNPEDNGLYGTFKELYENKAMEITLVGMYEKPFNHVYANVGGYYRGEAEFYLRHIREHGEKVLELASGDGRRFLIPLLKHGMQADGVEISTDMLELCREKLEKLPEEQQSRARLFNEDVYGFTSDSKYDAVILPATSICLFSETEDGISRLFGKVKEAMADKGVFIFDFRTGPEVGSETVPHKIMIKTENDRMPVVYQEFPGSPDGWNTVNFYTEWQGRKYMASSRKKLFTGDEIKKTLEAEGFEIIDSLRYSGGAMNIELLAAVLKG